MCFKVTSYGDAKVQQAKCHAQVLLLHEKCQESLFLAIFCNTDADGLEIYKTLRTNTMRTAFKGCHIHMGYYLNFLSLAKL